MILKNSRVISILFFIFITILIQIFISTNYKVVILRSTVVYSILLFIFIVSILTSILIRNKYVIGISISLVLTILSTVVFLINYVRMYDTADVEIESIRLTIVKPPILSNEYIKYYVKGEDGKRYFIKLDRYPEFDVGDYCIVSGSIVNPYTFEEFDYRRYLYSNGIYNSILLKNYKCYKDEHNSLATKLFSIKSLINSNIYKSVPSPYAEFMIGVLWGDNLSFDPTISNLFILTGTTHVIAASGFNVNIIYSIVDKVFFFINRKYRDILISLSLWIYSFLGGFSPSITRATLMAQLKIVNYNFMIPTESIIIFLYSIFITLFFKPYYVFNISFQLSSFATLGLIVISGVLKKTVLVKLGEDFVNTLSATISTLPITVVVFKKFSLMSVFINSILLFIINDLMLVTLFGSILYSINNNIGRYFLQIGMYISHSFLYSLQIMSEIFLNLNLGLISFE